MANPLERVAAGIQQSPVDECLAALEGEADLQDLSEAALKELAAAADPHISERDLCETIKTRRKTFAEVTKNGNPIKPGSMHKHNANRARLMLLKKNGSRFLERSAHQVRPMPHTRAKQRRRSPAVAHPCRARSVVCWL